MRYELIAAERLHAGCAVFDKSIQHARLNAGQRTTMQIDAECKVVNDPFGKERLMWAKLGY